MSGIAYDSIVSRRRLGFDEDGRSVPLEGVAQIPDDVHRTITAGGEFALTDEQMHRCDKVIWGEEVEPQRRVNGATHEIRRRHEAKLARVPVESYFGRSWDQRAFDEEGE